MDKPSNQDQLQPQPQPQPQLTKPRYFHMLQPQPLALPEIIDRIRSHLTIVDLKKCTLVCYTWAQCFGPFIWETFYYNRATHGNDPALQHHGRTIRQLYTFLLQDRDLGAITRHCPHLIGLELEMDKLQNPVWIYNLFNRITTLRRLTLRLSSPTSLSLRQRALLEPIAHGMLDQLTELRLVGIEHRRNAPVYQARTVFRCLEACPKLRLLELNAIRLVDTAEQWNDAAMNSFSSPTSVQVVKSRPSSSIFSWIPWTTSEQPQVKVTPQSSLAPDDAPEPCSSSCWELMTSLSTDRNREAPNAREGYKSDTLSVLLVSNVYFSSNPGPAVITSLLERAPNLTQLTLQSTPAHIDSLDTLCPKLKTAIFDDIHGANLPRPALEGYLHSNKPIEENHADPETTMMALSSLRMSRCWITDSSLANIQQDFIRYRLKRLEITQCNSISSLGLARFLGRCWSLETVWVDRLLMTVYPHLAYHRDRSRRRNVQSSMVTTASPAGSTSTANANVTSNAFPWECTQIRYLDLHGPVGDKNTFDNLVLDLVARLDKLEFLGISSLHVHWLMELEPLRYPEQQVPCDATIEADNTSDTAIITSPNQDQSTPLPECSPMSEADQEPLPLGLFETVRTLSIEAGNRGYAYQSIRNSILKLQHAKYLYHAFPVLEKIVYSSTDFPFEVEASEWLLNTPRRIETVHRPKIEAHAVVMDA
ncbi:hypothetical protein B0O80DRAFT_438093 [Mortierella sp. GBAus27b]|nr:hypothetical protein BGX31_005613 [Mortierella sp. GBA43]KAI8361642.1 hypothetical protein B0O80DRAFT_438093 [Mortierella sp. GBAus27b]